MHPTQDRFLTPRENATVMGFPLNYRLSERSIGYQEIGRGLCTHNARFLGMVVKDGLTRDEGVQVSDVGVPLQVVDWRQRGNREMIKRAMSKNEMRAWWAIRHSQLDCPF